MQSLKHRVCSHLHPKMPNRLKPRKSKRELLDPVVGTITDELEVPLASEIVFRKQWQIRKYSKTIAKRDCVDSPVFRCSVNGTTTFWNISIRFWKGPKGKKITNPVVTCLNLTACETEETGQARIRFQFGVWDATIKHWECCPISNVVLNLQNTQELLSVGYKSLGILDRHIDNAKDVTIMAKIQIVFTEEEKHSLSQDLARVYFKTGDEYFDTLVFCGPDLELEDEEPKEEERAPATDSTSETGSTASDHQNRTIRVNSLLVKARSPMLAVMLMPNRDESTNKNYKYKLELKEISYSLLKELFRYIYTDKFDHVESYANRMLKLSVKFCIPGLQSLCEKALIESITPNNVANVLLLADQCKCDNLRKAALHYCEESEMIKDNLVVGKTLAWRVMEMVNPELFLEACESIGSSSSNLDSPSTPGSYSDY